MSIMVFAPPYVPPPPPTPRWDGFGVTWTGWDGTTWNLNDHTSGVQIINAGVVGLHLPGYEPQTSDRRSGRRRRGVRVTERSIELPLFLWRDENTAAWIDHDRRFWHSFHPLREGTLTITSPDGTIRTIRAYCESDGGHAYDLDPARMGWAMYQLIITAERPYWLDESFPSRSWGTVDARLFFGGEDPDDPEAVEEALPFYISNFDSVENAVINNPGDVPAWPRWKIEAVTGSVEITITVAGGTIGVPTIPEGSVVMIDTDPAVATATMDGVDISGQLDPYDPRPIDDVYDESALEIVMSGVGIVTLMLTPRYLRAW